MAINKENILRMAILSVILLCFLVYFFIPFIDFNTFVILILVILLFLFFEAYLRIQHNVDRALRLIEEKSAEINIKKCDNKEIIEISNQLAEKISSNKAAIESGLSSVAQLAEKISSNKAATESGFNSVDAKFEQLNQSILESVRQFFIMKNDIVFKLAILRSELQENLDYLKNTAEEQRKSAESFLYLAKQLQFSRSKSIKAFWYRSNNIGDRLSPVIMEHIFQKKVEFAGSSEEGRLLAVGSILNMSKENDVVWGSGLIAEEKIKAPKGVKFLAVRGPLTRSMIDGEVPEIYGDPAILVPLIYNPKIEKTHKVGILPHYIDKPLWDDKLIPPDAKLIDIEANWKKVIDEILSCEMIRTSSLHGIILSEAYGIPVVWEKYSDNIVGGEFKFQDYFLGTGRNRQKYGEILPPLFDLKNKQDILIRALEQYYGKQYFTSL